jgi:hypothetical protein
MKKDKDSFKMSKKSENPSKMNKSIDYEALMNGVGFDLKVSIDDIIYQIVRLHKEVDELKQKKMVNE